MLSFADFILYENAIPGGTVGSGVFVLTGLVAREYTGPGVVISWLIAGFGCCFSAMSYAELSCRIPSAGSSYAYVYVALGVLIMICRLQRFHVVLSSHSIARRTGYSSTLQIHLI